MNLGHVLKTAFDLTDVGQRYNKFKEQKSEGENRRRLQDQEFADLMTQRGAKFVHGGTVVDGEVARPADKARTIKHKTVEGEELQFELPTPEEQLRTQTKRLLDQFKAETPIRDAKADEEVSLEGKKAEARSNAAAVDRTRRLQTEGVEVPDAIGEVLPGIQFGGPTPRPSAAAPMSADSDPGKFASPQKRKVLPDELDNIIRTSGSFLNYKSQADARDKKPTKEVQHTQITDDDKGNQTLVTVYKDGTKDEVPLTAKGKTAKATGANGALTAYQSEQLKNRAEDKKTAAVKTQQDKLDKIQADQNKLVADTEAASTEREELETQLAEGGFESAAQKAAAIKKSAILKAKIIANHVQHKALEDQKLKVDSIRKSLIGQTKAAADDATDKANPIKYNAAGDAVQWDGKQWKAVPKK
jgi:hypothetical protein